MRTGMCVAAALVLSGCGGDPPPPSRLDNACAILKERPLYRRAMRRTEDRWNVPMPVQMATIYQESRFDADARTPQRFVLGVIPMGRQSSAYGYSQALDGTWSDYKSATGRGRAKRDRIRDATDFMGWYMNQTAKRNGVPKTDARRQYLAYHEGHTGFARGSHRHKAWLMRVAGKVGARAALYSTQLRRCGRR